MNRHIVLLVLLGWCTIVMGVARVSAQVDDIEGIEVEVVLITGAINTPDNLTLEFRGSIPEPFAVTFDQLGDLQVDRANRYRFTLPFDFCDIFEYRLYLRPFSDTAQETQSWLGTFDMTIDGHHIIAYHVETNPGQIVTEQNWRGGTWPPWYYDDSCTQSFITIFTNTEVVSDDQPLLLFHGDFSSSSFPIYTSAARFAHGMSSALSPPMQACDVTGVSLYTQPRGESADDWHLSLFGVQLDDVLVYRREETLIIESEREYFFSWDNNPDYLELCADYDVPMPQIPPGTMLGDDVWVVPPPTWPDDHVFTLDEYHLIITPGMVTRRFTMPIAACHWLPHRLTVGQLARVTPGTPNRLRASPSTRGDILDLMPGGTVFRVLDGPICAEDFSWWQVDYNGVIGWTVEGMNFDYWLEPAR